MWELAKKINTSFLNALMIPKEDEPNSQTTVSQDTKWKVLGRVIIQNFGVKIKIHMLYIHIQAEWFTFYCYFNDLLLHCYFYFI